MQALRNFESQTCPQMGVSENLTKIDPVCCLVLLFSRLFPSLFTTKTISIHDKTTTCFNVFIFYFEFQSSDKNFHHSCVFQNGEKRDH